MCPLLRPFKVVSTINYEYVVAVFISRARMVYIGVVWLIDQSINSHLNSKHCCIQVLYWHFVSFNNTINAFCSFAPSLNVHRVWEFFETSSLILYLSHAPRATFSSLQNISPKCVTILFFKLQIWHHTGITNLGCMYIKAHVCYSLLFWTIFL